MEAARLDNLLERVHRRLVAERDKIAIEVVLELIAAALRPLHRLEGSDFNRIDDLGAKTAQLAECLLEHNRDLFVERRRIVRLTQDAKAGALQAVCAQ